MKAGHRKTRPPFNAAVRALADQVAKYRLPDASPDYNIRGPAVVKAHSLYNAAAQLSKVNPKDTEIIALLERTHALVGEAMDAAYPPAFTEDCQKLRQGDSAGLETALRFL